MLVHRYETIDEVLVFGIFSPESEKKGHQAASRLVKERVFNLPLPIVA